MLSAPSLASKRLRRAAGLVALAAAVGLAFGLDLGRARLWDPGEGRYAETVREMLLTHNWIVPTLDFAHYYDKPPGFFWIVAGCFRVFGMSEWAARLPAALSAVLTIAATVGFAWRRLGPRAAIGAGVILATAGEFVALGRSVRMDMLLTVLVTATLYYAYVVWTDENGASALAPQRAPTWPLYVLPAIGLLIKGPIAIILPVLVLGTFSALTGEYGRLRRFRPGLGLAVALAVAGSWYVIAAFRAPEYLWSFLWRQNVDRFFEGASGVGHSEPFWFYFWVLPLTFLPWALFLPGAFRRALQRARHGHDLDLFLLSWSVVVFVFFTISRAKLATYMLPLFPPLALLVAAYLRDAIAAPAVIRVRALMLPTLLWAVALLGLTVAIAIGVAVTYPSYAWRAASALTLLIFPLAALVLARTRRWQLAPALIAVAALASQMLFYRAGVPIVNEFSSLRAAAEVARALPEDARILAFKTRGHSFTFYGGRRLTRARSPESVAAALEGEAPVGLLTKAKYLDRIQAHLSEPACIWWQGVSGRVFLANRPFPDTARHAALLPHVDGSATLVASSPHC
ncbi:MAG: glycosyltransferase family 39 protein [Deltaproteobacteria bacterium]|nr:MAG: glycosyltransferase family 39 protein [Deltaproteobacteria bacterium]